MRTWSVSILIGFVMCLLCAATLAVMGSSSSAAALNLTVVSEIREGRPLEGPVQLEVRVSTRRDRPNTTA